MKAILKVENPDTIVMSLTLTMTVNSWERLKAQINSTSAPAWKLEEAINDLIIKAKTTFSTESSKDL